MQASQEEYLGLCQTYLTQPQSALFSQPVIVGTSFSNARTLDQRAQCEAGLLTPLRYLYSQDIPPDFQPPHTNVRPACSASSPLPEASRWPSLYVSSCKTSTQPISDDFQLWLFHSPVVILMQVREEANTAHTHSTILTRNTPFSKTCSLNKENSSRTSPLCQK